MKASRFSYLKFVEGLVYNCIDCAHNFCLNDKSVLMINIIRKIFDYNF